MVGKKQRKSRINLVKQIIEAGGETDVVFSSSYWGGEQARSGILGQRKDNEGYRLVGTSVQVPIGSIDMQRSYLSRNSTHSKLVVALRSNPMYSEGVPEI